MLYTSLHYDGNGRLARLLATLIMHLGSYGLRNIYSLDEYYAKNLMAYLELFQSSNIITAKDIGELLGFRPRACRALCQKWVESGFLTMVDTSKKGRKYRLAKRWMSLSK